MAVTSHFIDQQWVLRNRTLRFCFVPSPHTKGVIAKILMDCLSQYSLEIRRSEAKNNEEQISKFTGKRANPESSSGHVVAEDEYAQSKRTKKRRVTLRGEVDHYLEEDPMPENDDFDILDWWKRDHTYPTLQKIARDILAIPVSSVASESAFSMGGRVISSHRSRLHSKTVEALMCLQNWLVDDIRVFIDAKTPWRELVLVPLFPMILMKKEKLLISLIWIRIRYGYAVRYGYRASETIRSN